MTGGPKALTTDGEWLAFDGGQLVLRVRAGLVGWMIDSPWRTKNTISPKDIKNVEMTYDERSKSGSFTVFVRNGHGSHVKFRAEALDGFRRLKRELYRALGIIEEYHCTCQACGKGWHYDESDLARAAANVALNLGMALTMGPMFSNREVRELGRCPSCGSRAVLTELVRHTVSSDSAQ